MTILGKKQMSEEDIKLNYITPVILDGWKGHVTMETKITDGRINISGNIVARSKPKFADYMLYLNDGKPIAVVEAKDNNHSVSHGLQQAMTYAQMMDLPFAYSSNGDAFYEHDFLTGQEQQIALDKFPTQDELVARYYAELNGGKGISDLEKKIVSQPYYSSQSTYPPRYYQRNAVNRTVEAIENDKVVELPRLYNTIGAMFSRPYNGDASKYLPTQYIAEEIKNMGFDGLRFRSSLNKNGFNVVLFNPDDCVAVSSDLVEVKGIDLKLDEPMIYKVGTPKLKEEMTSLDWIK